MTKHKLFYKYTAFAVCVFLLASLLILPLSAQNGGIPCENSDKANAVYLYNLENEKILFHKNADLPVAPASTVKLMTALVVAELIPDLSRSVTVSKEAVSYTDMNVMSLKVGERLTALDLLCAMLCFGYNDATVALAINACGSIDAFVEKMNAKAAALGAKNTVYKDPTGLDDSARTTARDTFLIAKSFYENKRLLDLSSQTSYTIPATNMSNKRTVYNRNALISAYSGTKYLNAYARGMNAGMTDVGGYCLVTSAERSNMSYICIVMGARYDAENDTLYSYVIANELLNYVTKTLGKRTVIEKDSVITTMPVSGAGIKNNTADIVPRDTVSASLPADFESDDKFNVSYVYTKNELKAPVAEGEKVGVIVVSYNNEIVTICDLVTAEAIERDGFISVLDAIRAFLTSRFLISSLLCFVFLFAIYALILPTLASKKKKKRYQNNRYR